MNRSPTAPDRCRKAAPSVQCAQVEAGSRPMRSLLVTCLVSLSLAWTAGAAAAAPPAQDTRDMPDRREMPDRGGMEEPDGKFVEVNGARLFYQEAGTGEPIVLVHGYPLSSGLFVNNIETLARRFHVYAVTLRGYGKSTAPSADADATVASYGADVLAFMDALGIERAIIGGMSMGGPIVFSMYQQAPEKFSGMLLMDTIAAPATAVEQGLWQGVVNFVQKGNAAALPGLLIDEMLTAQSRMEHPELTKYVTGLMEKASQPALIAGARALASRPDFRPLLSQINVPTLIIVGKQDTIYPYEISQKMQKQIAGSQLAIIDGGSHAVTIEEPERTNAAILRWATGAHGRGGTQR